ncbi:bifunctional 4-hydroxy-2-oxoglutarate aldolase/2-dehydro-3-deoxy-phosphogluconate aldolase [Thermoanaerobacterium sp. DL9XJH110]|uniref:bifunctional 4-hydroxy-2-oxoglutarate aldolase/2-dehydro-3-deoxy-phosphogluconate aldolase n=1 Tax=Thermoanaerobacterium sp. DL9XJH110 TaxID=3386643 RepID=UPI003BB5E99D
MDIVEKVLKNRILPIVRGVTGEKIDKYVSSLKAADIDIIEVSLSTLDALETINYLKKTYPDMTVGAGTVLNIEDAVKAMEAGAQFIVTPGYIPELVDFLKMKDVPVIPGVATPTDITRAVCQKVYLLKIFPASQLTTEFFKAVQGPFPMIKMMAVGGITVDNASEFIKAGACSIGMGNGLFKGEDGADISEHDFKVRINGLKNIFNEVKKE